MRCYVMRSGMRCCAGGYAATQRRRWCGTPLSFRSTSAEVSETNEGVERGCRGMKVKKNLLTARCDVSPKVRCGLARVVRSCPGGVEMKVRVVGVVRDVLR